MAEAVFACVADVEAAQRQRRAAAAYQRGGSGGVRNSRNYLWPSPGHYSYAWLFLFSNRLKISRSFFCARFNPGKPDF